MSSYAVITVEVNMWIIKDWADNHIFNGQEFNSFEDAEEFLTEFMYCNDISYDESRSEYVISSQSNCHDN